MKATSLIIDLFNFMFASPEFKRQIEPGKFEKVPATFSEHSVRIV